VLPSVVVMIFAVIVLCMLPGIATWLADAVMGR
jgi:TRAP-type C4-dicarboxylate transport system permease large subunit